MSQLIKGELVILDIWDGAAYKPVGGLTSNTLSVEVNIMEAQIKDNPGIILRQAGSSSSTVAYEANYIKTDSTKTDFDAMLGFVNTISGTTQTWRMSSDQTTPVYYYGTGIFSSLELTSAAGDEFATYSGELQNTGLIVTVDPNA